MTEVNLHELINQKGAGKHVPILVKAGLWDEWAGFPMKKWVVEVEYRETSLIRVDARCKEEAEEKADKIATQDYDNYEFTGVNECN